MPESPDQANDQAGHQGAMLRLYSRQDITPPADLFPVRDRIEEKKRKDENDKIGRGSKNLVRKDPAEIDRGMAQGRIQQDSGKEDDRVQQEGDQIPPPAHAPDQEAFQ